MYQLVLDPFRDCKSGVALVERRRSGAHCMGPTRRRDLRPLEQSSSWLRAGTPQSFNFNSERLEMGDCLPPGEGCSSMETHF